MKSQRQAKIMEIISNRNVETQEQLLAELKNAGFHSTQATISRDIKELRIVKELTSFGTYRYTAATEDVSGTFSSRLNTSQPHCQYMPCFHMSQKRRFLHNRQTQDRVSPLPW